MGNGPDETESTTKVPQDGLKGLPETVEDPEDWAVHCSDDELYNPAGGPGDVWEPKPDDIKTLYEKLAKGENLELEWVCPGRRSPSPEKTDISDDVKDEPEEAKEEERVLPKGFDFDEEIDPGIKPGFTPRRTPGSAQTPRSQQKRVARMDKIMSDILRHKKIEEDERKNNPMRRFNQTPKAQKKPGVLAAQRRLLTSPDNKPSEPQIDTDIKPPQTDVYSVFETSFSKTAELENVPVKSDLPISTEGNRIMNTDLDKKEDSKTPNDIALPETKLEHPTQPTDSKVQTIPTSSEEIKTQHMLTTKMDNLSCQPQVPVVAQTSEKNFDAPEIGKGTVPGQHIQKVEQEIKEEAKETTSLKAEENNIASDIEKISEIPLPPVPTPLSAPPVSSQEPIPPPVPSSTSIEDSAPVASAPVPVVEQTQEVKTEVDIVAKPEVTVHEPMETEETPSQVVTTEAVSSTDEKMET